MKRGRTSKGKLSPVKRKRSNRSRRAGSPRRGYLIRDSSGEQRRLSLKAFFKTAKKSREKSHELLQAKAAQEWDAAYPPSDFPGDEKYERRRDSFIREATIRKLGRVHSIRRKHEQYFKSRPVLKNRKDPKTGRVIRNRDGTPRKEIVVYKSGPRKGRQKRIYYRKVKGRVKRVSEATVRANVRRWNIEGVARFLEAAYAVDPRDSKRLAVLLVDADDPEILQKLTELGIDTDLYRKMSNARRKKRRGKRSKRELKKGRR